MEEVRVLFIAFCIYAILYCVYAFNVVLAYRDVQTRRFKQMEKDVDLLNKLYLHLVSKCNETPKKDLSINEISSELRRLKQKAISKLNIMEEEG